MSKEITEEQFNASIPVSGLEKSFRELLNEDFVKDIRGYLIHEVRNMSHHSGFENLFNYEYIDHYSRVRIEHGVMDDPFFINKETAANTLKDLPFNFSWKEASRTVDALVIPFMDGYGSACHIKLCISIDTPYPVYEVHFQIRGARAWSRVPVRPHTALKIIKTLQYPNKVF